MAPTNLKSQCRQASVPLPRQHRQLLHTAVAGRGAVRSGAAGLRWAGRSAAAGRAVAGLAATNIGTSVYI